MRHDSIRTRTILVLLAISLLILLVIGGLWVYSTYRTVKSDIVLSNMQDARLISRYVDSYLANIALADGVVAGSPDTIEAVLRNDRGRLKQIGDSLNESLPDSDLIVILDNRSNVLYHSKGANTTGFVTEGWYSEALKKNGTYVSGLYYSYSTKRYVFSVVVPVKTGGSTIGYIISPITPDTLNSAIQQQLIHPGRNILVVDNHGLVVSHDNRSSVENNQDISFALPVQYLMNGTEGVVETSQTFDRQLRIVGFSPVSISGWGIIASTPLSVVYAQISNGIIAILALIAGGIPLVILASYFISRYLTDPVLELSDTMKQVSAGNYRVRAKTARKDEIGDLSRTFNSMMDELERTVELERAAEILKKYQLIFQRAGDPILSVDAAGKILDANNTAPEVYGYTRDELLSMSLSDLTIPADRSRVPGLLQRCFIETCKLETVHVRKNGSTFPVEINAAGTLIGDRQVMIAVIRDITERKLAEEALRKSEAHLARSQEIGHLGSFEWDLVNREDEWSDELFRIFGVKRSEVRPSLEAYLNIVYPDDREIVKKHAEDVLKGHRYTGGYEVRIVRPDGSMRWIRVEGKLISDRAGKPVRMFGTMLDITGRKEAEEAVKAARDQAEKEKERAIEETQRAELYLDIMSHDINNLNQTTLMNLEIIKDDPGLTSDERESLEAAFRGAQGSSAIISNVRKLQQITSGKLEPHIVDLDGLITECIKEAPRPAGKAVTINYAPKPGMLVKAAALLKEVFCNLVNNSIKYSGDEVTVDIVAGESHVQDRKSYQITVTDNGYGIPDQVKPKLFTRFQRGTTKAHGKGLGLYIVRSLLERFEGSVTVDDRVPGDYTQGSKFTVTLPAVDAEKRTE